MTRHTRSKQLIKLAMMQGEDVNFAKWNYSPGHNIPIEYSFVLQGVLDPTFEWRRVETYPNTFVNYISYSKYGYRILKIVKGRR
ncbi:hypothetical protein P4H82_27415 [Bacillus cereus]|nr:hypothetical protein [Bacillus cereus]MEB9190486.1 hypothetical protein [Bacillus cereus]